tara:strand:- start:1957 stop:2157 length:201 start_codon:yes stop_codon:yes gene_type:complete
VAVREIRNGEEAGMDCDNGDNEVKQMLARLLAESLVKDLVKEFGIIIDLPTEEQICRDLEEPQKVD